jgi:hypothetical protein
MPSDRRMGTAINALAGSMERYRSAVVTTAEEVRGYLASRQPSSDRGDESVAVGLGQFAVGRIDVDRFSSLLTNAPVEDAGTLEKVEGAYKILSDIASGGDDVFRVEVKSGGRLRDAVAGRWAEIGRAFAAARVAGMARAGSLNSSKNDKLLGPMEFQRWNEMERQIAPPLAVEVDGADLHAGELAEFLDGSVKIVLVVRGESPPAPLVRLITPSTFVLQTSDETGLDRFSDFAGPAVAALVPEDAARFIHDPAAGSQRWDRIEIFHLPEEAPKKAVGGVSVRQQTEELEQLRSLAGSTGATEAEAEGEAAVAAQVISDNPVDKLAAWLLSQADLSSVE